MRETYDKLVRDDIPDLIADNGERPVTHVATGEEYRERLHEKLDEEVAEFHDDPCVDELADLLEVVDALGEEYGIDAEQLAEMRRNKADKRGRFEDGVILEAVEQS